MKRSKFTEAQIVSILKLAEQGAKVTDICREHGISSATYYQWKSKYGGLEASDLKRLRDMEAENGVTIRYIEPGKPNQNAYIERFNKSYRNEVLDPHLFSCLTQVRELSWAWMISYNEERPHESLGNLPPSEFKRRVTAKVSSYELCA